MTFKRTIAALLCVGMLVAAFAGCAKSDVREYTDPTEDPSATVEPTVAPAEETTDVAEETTDYTYAYEKYDPEALVMNVDGIPVYWQEYFYWLTAGMSVILNYTGIAITDWEAECLLDATMTNSEFVTEYALSMLKQYRGLESNVSAMGVELDEEDEQYVIDTWNEYVTNYSGGDEEAFKSEFLEPIYMTKEFFDYLSTLDCLFYGGLEEKFGENGENFSDEDTIEFAENKEYLAAKHILVMTVDPTTGEELTESALAEKTALAEDILAQLQAAPDLAAKFDELMNEYSEDTGLAMYPQGYIFGSGEMVAEFEDATKALEPGAISEIVESSYGYHIIMRLPLDPDMLMEADPYGGEGYSLRYVAAISVYETLVGEWKENAEVVWEPEFENIDTVEIFAK